MRGPQLCEDRHPWKPRAARCRFETSSKPAPDTVLPMALFHITVREHTYTGRFYSDVVEAVSSEEALQLAAGQAITPPLPPGSKQQPFNVTVRDHTFTGQFYSDVVEAGSGEEALQLAAGQATGLQPPPGPEPQPDDSRCADVWVYPLLHCELVEGHDLPHMAVARGYGRAVRWVRDVRGIARITPEPATSRP